jgi:hypothetical protein
VGKTGEKPAKNRRKTGEKPVKILTVFHRFQKTGEYIHRFQKSGEYFHRF